jgi:hypothetical protein
MNGSKPDTRELFGRIAKLSSEAEWTLDETREALSEAGVRPDDVAERILQLVTRLKKESPLHWKTRAHALRHELLEKVRGRVSAEIAGLTRPQLLQKLNEAIERLPTQVATQYGVAFRKFEDATEEDLRSMLEEVALIDDLERDQQI